MQIIWEIHPLATAIHAALAIEAGNQPVDEELARALAGPLNELQQAAKTRDLSSTTVLMSLGEQAAAGANQPELMVQVTLDKTLGVGHASDESRKQLTQGVRRLFSAFDSWRTSSMAKPLDEELALRIGPMRQLWEARGPGLLRQMESLTEPIFLADRVTVAPVLPVLGGHGVALPRANAVLVEAVLANPHPQLPEVLRLVWLLAQLNVDLPPIEELTEGTFSTLLIARAMLPAVLAAGEALDLVQASSETIAEALLAWRVIAPDDQQIAGALAEQLWQWWRTYRSSPTPWTVAYVALEQMLRA